jgi:hypothetical protein
MPLDRRRAAWWATAALAAAAVAAGAWRGVRSVELHVEAALRRAGLSAREVRFSWIGPLRLREVKGESSRLGPITIDALDAHWRLFGGRDPRSHLARVVLHGLRATRGPLSAAWTEADFVVTAWTHADGVEHIGLRQRTGGGSMDASWRQGGHAGEAVLNLHQLDLGQALLTWNGEAIFDPGRWSGRASLGRAGEGFTTAGSFHGDAVRVAAPRSMQAGGGVGVPTPMDVEWTLRGSGESTEIERLEARVAGVDVHVKGVVQPSNERHVDLDLQAHCELATAFRTAGLPPPLKDVRADRFGAASLDLVVRGPLAEPGDLFVDPRLRFEPEPEATRALAYLRGPFPYRPADSPGVTIDVREGARDFIAIEAVPPLLQRALLISEDAGFQRHCGIDLTEIAAAWAENEEDGRRLRGASTLTQQLVKNLLLSNEKTYGRKIEEAALALMVDAVVSKPRLLEIYLNIIEWGPHLHGLVPAARHYFGKRPSELTPKEMAFLVCLIPNPVRYHQAHESGHLGPGMDQLVRNLLAKLRSLGDLGEDEYEQALAEELVFVPETSAAD